MSHVQIDALVPGSLVQDMGELFLYLWEEISWPELVWARHSFVSPKIVMSLCSPTTIDTLHRMVYEWFSSYKDVIPLFFWSDIDVLLRHRPKTLLSKTHDWTRMSSPQRLFIFPSLLALVQYRQWQDVWDNSLILSGQSTPVQRAKAYRAVQSGQVDTLFVTHSQMFWDWNSSVDIHLFDPYSPLYEVHQEPRYAVSAVVDSLVTFLSKKVK